jgi:hypothetical protein
VRELDPEQIALMQHGAPHYVGNAQGFRKELKRIG